MFSNNKVSIVQKKKKNSSRDNTSNTKWIHIIFIIIQIPTYIGNTNENINKIK